MSEVKKENIELVVNGLNEFFRHVIETKGFNLSEFVNFMEPKFAEAGYRSTPPPQQINILILTLGSAGDFIAQSGMIREVRRIYPKAHITLAVGLQTLALAEFCPYVDEILINEKNCSRMDIVSLYEWNMNLVEKLLKRHFDICYSHVGQSLEDIFLSYMSGAYVRIIPYVEDYENNFSILRFFSGLINHVVPRHNYGSHVVDLYLSMIDNTLHAPVSNRSIEVWYTPLDVTIAKTLIEKATSSIYALSMGGSHPRKFYPPEKYAELLKMILQKEPTATFVILGGGQLDLQSAEIIKNTIPEIYEKKIIDLTNKINYRQSAAVLSLCNMYIGNDTGITHAAEAVKCPVLVANCFPADLPQKYSDVPRIWSPYCVPSVTVQPSHALSECKDHTSYDPYGCKVINRPHCITQITPETLYKGFKILKKRIAEKNIEPFYLH